MKNDFSFLLYACRENLLILSQPKDCYQILLEISLFLVALIFQRKVRSVYDLEWRKRLSRGLSSDVAVCGGRKKLTSAGEKKCELFDWWWWWNGTCGLFQHEQLFGELFVTKLKGTRTSKAKLTLQKLLNDDVLMLRRVWLANHNQ